MANATVEKMKNLGLRHGEKAVLVVVSLVTLLLVVQSLSRPSFDITPDQVKQAAESASSNLGRPQSQDSIIERLDTEFQLVPVDFAAKVDALDQRKGVQYVMSGPPFVQPEPGAGLMRDMPTLLPPSEMYATAGRGAIQVFDRDQNEEIIYVEVKKDAPKKESTSRKRRGARNRGGAMSGGGYGGMGAGMGMGMGMGGQPKSGLTKEEEKKKAAQEAQRKANLFVGNATEVEEEKQIEEKAKEGKEPKKVTRGYRWVALVGVLDHQKIKDNYVKALKDPNAAPHYLRLDLQRQELQGDQWSDWQPIDRKFNELVDASFVEQDDELAPDNVLLDGLVARLPFLSVGYYHGVHVASLVPKEKREAPKPPSETDGMSGYPGMMGAGGGKRMGMEGGMAGGYPGMGMGTGSSGGGGRKMMGMEGGMAGGYPGMGMGMGSVGGGGGGPEDTNFDKSSAEQIMVRALDYTVDPDTAYRYRVRLVVRNPNLGWETVNPGVDTTTEELEGPWSDALEPVRVPADVTIYAQKKSPLAGKRSDAVQFQVVRWEPSSGLTVVKTVDEGPGAIVGESMTAAVPKDDGKGIRSKEIDFTSRQVILDSAGGSRPLTPLGAPSSTFEAPAFALVIRNDGQLVLRDQARDTTDPEMQQLADIYKETIKDAEEGGKKKPTGGGYPGMGGSGKRGASSL